MDRPNGGRLRRAAGAAANDGGSDAYGQGCAINGYADLSSQPGGAAGNRHGNEAGNGYGNGSVNGIAGGGGNGYAPQAVSKADLETSWRRGSK